MKKIALMFLVLIGVASLLLAQGPGGAPDPAMMVQRQLQMLTSTLNLTSAQQQQATAIFTTAATSQSAMQNSMRSARQALDTAVKANDAAGMDKAAATVGNVTAQMTLARAKADAAFNQILTPEQQTKLEQMRGNRGPGGPGGPGGPRGMGSPGGPGGPQ